MIQASHPPPSRPAPAFPGVSGGFTLVQLMLAVLCLGLAGYIAILEIRKFVHHSQREAFIAELQQVAAAFEEYRNQNGEWPPATGGEIIIPRGMESALANTHWLSGLPFGGGYEWVPPPPPMSATGALPIADAPAVATTEPPPPAPAYIAITACTPRPALALSTADLVYIDAKIDDGNLSTGRFRTGFNGWPVYRVKANR